MKMPFNLLAWIEENRADLKPPVGNKQLYDDTDFMVFAVGGPNARADYHNRLERGVLLPDRGGRSRSSSCATAPSSRSRSTPGEIFLLPAMIPHSPQRPAESVGLVIEHKRAEGELDGLRWYCDALRRGAPRGVVFR